jgi:hypothetical protein
MGEIEKTELTYRAAVSATAQTVTKEEIQHQADRELKKAGFKIAITRYVVDKNTYYEAIGGDGGFSHIALVKIWYHYEPL